MSFARTLNRPGALGKAWRAGYEIGYGALKAMVLLLFRPLFAVRRVGPEPAWPAGGFLICPNHTSYLDPAFLQLVVPRRITFVMTNDFYALPFARWFFALVGAVPMARGRRARRALHRAAALVRRGHVVAFFPEGRLSQTGAPGEPQRGIGYLARRTGAPILPVGVAGAFRVWPRKARWFRRSDVRLLFGQPLRWSAPLTGSDEAQRSAERAFALHLMDRVRGLVENLGVPRIVTNAQPAMSKTMDAEVEPR